MPNTTTPLTDQDYAVVIGDDALKVLSRASRLIRETAEQEAVEEIASYLRPVYDTAAIFAAEGDGRNRLIVMFTADIALYHMVASMPQKMGIDVRKERYDRAIRWLEGVQAGRIVPDLPRMEQTAGTPASGTVYHTEPRLGHNW